MDTVEALRHYNRWSRGLDGENPDDAPDPRAIGQQIDAACAEIERLRSALLMAVRQNEHDMLMTGEELRVCRAALRPNDQA